jgi:hypothetical protein
VHVRSDSARPSVAGYCQCDDPCLERPLGSQNDVRVPARSRGRVSVATPRGSPPFDSSGTSRDALYVPSTTGQGHGLAYQVKRASTVIVGWLPRGREHGSCRHSSNVVMTPGAARMMGGYTVGGLDSRCAEMRHAAPRSGTVNGARACRGWPSPASLSCRRARRHAQRCRAHAIGPS